MIMAALYQAATTVGVSFKLLAAICMVESSYNPNAVNGTHYGLCQIKLSTAREMGFTQEPSRLFNPYINAYFSAKYLQKQLKRYKGDTEKAIAAYNAGTVTYKNGSLTNSGYTQRVSDLMIGLQDDVKTAMEVSEGNRFRLD